MAGDGGPLAAAGVSGGERLRLDSSLWNADGCAGALVTLAVAFLHRRGMSDPGFRSSRMAAGRRICLSVVGKRYMHEQHTELVVCW
ncbi:unnamed protein product [Fusarium graminearum]|nr:unnamed protein product [Fusarium graminearum]